MGIPMLNGDANYTLPSDTNPARLASRLKIVFLSVCCFKAIVRDILEIAPPIFVKLGFFAF